MCHGRWGVGDEDVRRRCGHGCEVRWADDVPTEINGHALRSGVSGQRRARGGLGLGYPRTYLGTRTRPGRGWRCRAGRPRGGRGQRGGRWTSRRRSRRTRARGSVCRSVAGAGRAREETLATSARSLCLRRRRGRRNPRPCQLPRPFPFPHVQRGPSPSPRGRPGAQLQNLYEHCSSNERMRTWLGPVLDALAIGVL